MLKSRIGLGLGVAKPNSKGETSSFQSHSLSFVTKGLLNVQPLNVAWESLSIK